MFRQLSLKIKLTIIFVLIFGSSLIAFSIFLYQSVSDAYQSEFDLALHNFAVEVGDSIDLSLLGYVSIDRRVFEEDRKIFPFSLNEALIEVRSIGGTPMAKTRSLGDRDLPFERSKVSNLEKGYLIEDWNPETLFGAYRSYRVIHYAIRRVGFSRFVLQIAVPTQMVTIHQRKIATIFTYSVAALIIGSSLLGFYFSHLALEPIRKMISKAQSIKVEDLSARIPTPNSKDELNDLAVTLNGLLERMERAFQSQERFVSDASHQLKTPLAILKGELELLEPTPQVHSLQEEVDHLIKLVNDLLVLARVDTGASALNFEPVQLDEIVMSAVERLNRFAIQKGIHLLVNFTPELQEGQMETLRVRGDHDLLVSLFETLIENAIKYSPEKSTVCVEMARGPTIRILDQGPGLDENEKSQLFARFHRGKKAKGSTTGSGLGLAIAARISELHSARLELLNRSSGGLEVLFQMTPIS